MSSTFVNGFGVKFKLIIWTNFWINFKTESKVNKLQSLWFFNCEYSLFFFNFWPFLIEQNISMKNDRSKLTFWPVFYF